VTFFFDNCVSKKICGAIREARRSETTHLSEEFPRYAYPRGCPDLVWIPAVGANQWVLFCGDLRILKNPANRAALEKANIVAYFVYRDYLSQKAWPQLKWVISVWDDVAEHAEAAAPGTNYQVTRSGVIKVVTTYRDFE
jgi:hypothetical protein